MRKPYLSKSKILSGAQCHKRLYLEVHNPELMKTSSSAEQNFEIGHQVGEVARSLWPNGILIEHDQQLAMAITQTRELLATRDPVTLFEATIETDGVLVRNDILERSKKGLRLVEVKASSSMKDYHALDVAIQVWVLRKAGLVPDIIELAHINTDFVYQGDSDYHGLFTFVDMRSLVEEQLNRLPETVSELRKVILGSVPAVSIGKHCHQPFECPFLHYCTPPQPEYPVSLLPYGGKTAEALHAEGFADLRDVPKERLTNPNHLRVWRATNSGKPELLAGAKGSIAGLTYPRYYMDFETVQFAVPIWKGTHPYEQLPFQWSCHIENFDGSLRHEGFLDTSGKAPMDVFCRALLACVGEQGPIFVYNAAFEKSILNDMAVRFPHHSKKLSGLTERIVDLLPLTRENYYHPAMKGSWSIKAVIPTIAPHLAYDGLGEVRDGNSAPAAYLEIIDTKTSTSRRSLLINDLKQYCERDTLAMVELLRFLTQ